MTEHFLFHSFHEAELKKLVSTRQGETRLGESVSLIETNDQTRFVILGIQESIGPQANLGAGGAEGGFNAFLSRFLNMQENEFLAGRTIHLAGRIEANTNVTDRIEMRKIIPELDEMVEMVLRPYVEKGITPIVIGGGHNNAYPIIKTISKSHGKGISVINLDPHADCRALEGRHSGNPFSYAIEEGYLEKYSVIGLHQAYNNQFIIDFLRKNKCFHTFFENYLDQPETFKEDIDSAVRLHNESEITGIELDMDSIAFMPSSAFTPSGFSVNDARYFIRKTASIKNVRYFHLPEAAPQTEQEIKICGKTLAYLVWDFISERNKQQ